MVAVSRTLAALAFVGAALAVPTGTEKRAASCSFPSPPKTSSLTAAKTIASGTTFDGGNVRFDRGSGACKGQSEGGDKDAVFILQQGATLSNVVIGANQMEGVHCLGSCTLNNVWFEGEHSPFIRTYACQLTLHSSDVCEDAITIKQTSGTSTITGGGAKNADDKIVQHNGGGTVVIDSFCAQTFGKLYRSCGNCSTQYKRTSTIKNIIASSGSVLAGINSNYGDVSTLSGLSLSSVKSVCDTYSGNSSGAEPSKLTSNTANSYCKF
ncbi:polysaccharide lyase family 3 protein [Botryobasidium botryosum FD-172 SS1]|uniref:Pectate lyase n=1 Tax=Botryobasidium botryosum (strain FD-172 SS1) TaxID=930990 RepID=A0A067M5U2_BOTB1|nr:polysaccharide lyase family 3 protein [Botryobasidium botryosum FD-172 SS1]